MRHLWHQSTLTKSIKNLWDFFGNVPKRKHSPQIALKTFVLRPTLQLKLIGAWPCREYQIKFSRRKVSIFQFNADHLSFFMLFLFYALDCNTSHDNGATRYIMTEYLWKKSFHCWILKESKTQERTLISRCFELSVKPLKLHTIKSIFLFNEKALVNRIKRQYACLNIHCCCI